jgi:hypothetical protein
MSQVRYDPLNPNEARNVGPVNTIFTAITTAGAAGALNQVNLGEEGLDETPFVDFAQAEVLEPVQVESRVGASLAVTGAGVWANLVHGATTLITPNPITLLAGDLLRVRFHQTLETRHTNGLGLTNGSTYGIRTRWNDGMVTTIGQQRFVTWSYPGHGWISTMLVIPGPVTVSWIDIQYSLSAGVCWPLNSQLTPTRFRRIA